MVLLFCHLGHNIHAQASVFCSGNNLMVDWVALRIKLGSRAFEVRLTMNTKTNMYFLLLPTVIRGASQTVRIDF